MKIFNHIESKLFLCLRRVWRALAAWIFLIRIIFLNNWWIIFTSIRPLNLFNFKFWSVNNIKFVFTGISEYSVIHATFLVIRIKIPILILFHRYYRYNFDLSLLNNGFILESWLSCEDMYFLMIDIFLICFLNRSLV